MEIKKMTVQSEVDGLQLHVTTYEPSGERKGVLQILHGMCEFKERYAPFMEYFCANGYVVVCHDQRGHGDSVKKQEDLGYFYDYSGEAIVEDAAQMTRKIKAEYPHLPVILFGHSMGSMVARCYLQKYDTLVDKAIICGSPSKNPLVGTAIFMSKCIRLFAGARHRSKLLAYLSTGKGNNKFPNEKKGAWLSQNRENVKNFYAHPKNKIFTCNGFENLFKLMKRTYKKKAYAVQNPTLPIHFVSGSDDAVMGNEMKWFAAIEDLRDVGYENVSGKLYKGLRHEIFSDIGGEEVLSDLLAFMQIKGQNA